MVEGSTGDRDAAFADVAEVPPAAAPKYGKGDFRIAQANVSDLKSIKRALREPPDKPDLENAMGSIAAAGLVAFKILYDGASSKWHVPSTGYEVFVLLAVVVHAYVASTKYIKAFKFSLRPKGLTADAMRQINGHDSSGGVNNPRYTACVGPVLEEGTFAENITADRVGYQPCYIYLRNLHKDAGCMAVESRDCGLGNHVGGAKLLAED